MTEQDLSDEIRPPHCCYYCGESVGTLLLVPFQMGSTKTKICDDCRTEIAKNAAYAPR